METIGIREQQSRLFFFSFAGGNGIGSLKDEESQFFSVSLLISTTPAESNLFGNEPENAPMPNSEERKGTGGKGAGRKKYGRWMRFGTNGLTSARTVHAHETSFIQIHAGAGGFHIVLIRRHTHSQ